MLFANCRKINFNNHQGQEFQGHGHYREFGYDLKKNLCCAYLNPLNISLDPYVKVYLVCQGKRIKKKKTSVKRSTLNPVYNEALVFDVPAENIEDVSLIVKVIDYDR